MVQWIMAGREQDSAVKPSLTAAEKQLFRHRQELHHWQKNTAMLRRRNLLTGLAIGTFVVGMCILHRVLNMFKLSKMHLNKIKLKVTPNLEKASVGIFEFKFS